MRICFSFRVFMDVSNSTRLIAVLSEIFYRKDFKLLMKYLEIYSLWMIRICSLDIEHNQCLLLNITHWLSLNLQSLIMTPQAHQIMFERINWHLAAGMRHWDLDWMMLLNLRLRQPFLRRVEVEQIVFVVGKECNLSLDRVCLRCS